MRTRFLRFEFMAALSVALAFPLGLQASSHSEAPGTAKDRLADDTDLYAWVADDATNKVTIAGNWVPLLEPNGGPNFYGFDDEAFYYVNIDNVGDCLDHIRYQFKFTTTRLNGGTFLYNTGVVTSLNDPDLNVRQAYTLTRYDDGVPTVLITNAPVAPNFVGPASMPDYQSLAQAAIQQLPDGTRVFVGPRDDPFFVDLGAVFDLLTIRKVPGNKGKGVDGVAGFNVLSAVLQIPKTRLTRDGQVPGANNAVIGIYDSAERFSTRSVDANGNVMLSGSEIQVSRLGHPLVNEVVIPLQDKDRFNRTKPTGDGVFAPYVVDPELARLFNLLYGLPIPTTPRNDLVTVFLSGIPGLNKPANPNQVLCEMLRLNMSIPPNSEPDRFGVIAGDNAGFPNGRRLFDDVVDIEERAVAGGYAFTPAFNAAPANQLGDGIDANDLPFLPYFPYLAPPHSPFRHPHHGEQHGVSTQSLIGHGRFFKDEAGGDADAATQAQGFGPLLRLAGPNPATVSRLAFAVPTPGRVTLRLFDARGRLVRTLVDQDAAAGSFTATWDGRDDRGEQAAPGVYFARYTAGSLRSEKKVTLR